jgi:ectoine hydroxylase-related dioxygenase (phytanoyl-CoA dioxygenase family)
LSVVTVLLTAFCLLPSAFCLLPTASQVAARGQVCTGRGAKTVAVTLEQRLFYEANGYLVVAGALSGEELARVRAAAERAEAAWRADPARPGLRNSNLQQVQAILEYDDLFLDLLDHPRVFPLVHALLGDQVSMIDHDYFISPPHSRSHARWHHDVGMPGVYHPRSTLMVKVFYLLTDVGPEGGATALLPGSHRFPPDFAYPRPDNPGEMPGHVRMAHPAGAAFLFNGRTYHAALDNESDQPRRVIIMNYGHFWMKPWQGYEASGRLKKEAATAVRRQLLGVGDAYGQRLTEEDWKEYKRQYQLGEEL